MAQTTTAIAPCNSVIEVDNGSGTPVNVSGSTQKFDESFDSNISESFTFEGEYPIRIQCKRNSSLNITAMYTRDGAEARALLEAWYQTGGLRTVAVYPEGQVIGARFYSAEYFLKSLKFSGDASSSDPMMMDAELLPSGAVDFDNYTT